MPLNCKLLQVIRSKIGFTFNDETLDHGNFLEILTLISKFDPLLKDHIDSAVIKSLKVHEDNKNTNKISSGRPGNLVTFL